MLTIPQSKIYTCYKSSRILVASVISWLLTCWSWHNSPTFLQLFWIMNMEWNLQDTWLPWLWGISNSQSTPDEKSDKQSASSRTTNKNQRLLSPSFSWISQDGVEHRSCLFNTKSLGARIGHATLCGGGRTTSISLTQLEWNRQLQLQLATLQYTLHWNS